ncbi:MAG: hypothetical protein Q9175_004220, partial [Cornicularia normoerica]
MVGSTGMALHILTILQDAIISPTLKPHRPYGLKGINSTVHIAVALNDKTNGPTHADGRAPTLVAFNERKWYIGASNWVATDH